MGAGTHTARSLTEAYLGRIEEIDGSLRSVIEVNPDAVAIAVALDAERKAKGPRGPLHGIPVVIKDNIATAGRMATTAGSLALIGAQAPRDSFVAERLRVAGAVILGKANLSEWANFRSPSRRAVGAGGAASAATRTSSTAPRAARVRDRGGGVGQPGSGGVGTETDGSIVCPSGDNALVGIKPTLGLVSRAGDRADLPRAGHRRTDGAARRTTPRRCSARSPEPIPPTPPPRPVGASAPPITRSSSIRAASRAPGSGSPVPSSSATAPRPTHSSRPPLQR